MSPLTEREAVWAAGIVSREEIDRYLPATGAHFVDDVLIRRCLREQASPPKELVRDVIAKSTGLERLEPSESAALLNCEDPELIEEMCLAGLELKQKVYGRRIVVFAPLYVSNICVNNCVYCGLRRDNASVRRERLEGEALRAETRALLEDGQKRLITVFGEHPSTDVDFMVDSIRVVYGVESEGESIRRVNVNAPPLRIADLGKLRDVGIGTYQVFQETYHEETYRRVHPAGTVKGDYLWRLYSMHRALEAGVDDVGIGALFGLYDYRYEVLGLLLHTMELERRFDGVGPHTISFPRLEPAMNTPFTENPAYRVSNDEFRKLVAVLRLSVPYTGLILTAREPAEVRRRVIPVGVTQIDAGSNISIGGYSRRRTESERQQFLLCDNRSLDETISELVDMGMITSFCTAGYRCGRTGNYFMEIAKQGKVGSLCMPNAILTFAEYLIDHSSEGTREKGWKLIEQELGALPGDELGTRTRELLDRIKAGERDLYL